MAATSFFQAAGLQPSMQHTELGCSLTRDNASNSSSRHEASLHCFPNLCAGCVYFAVNIVPATTFPLSYEKTARAQLLAGKYKSALAALISSAATLQHCKRVSSKRDALQHAEAHLRVQAARRKLTLCDGGVAVRMCKHPQSSVISTAGARQNGTKRSCCTTC